MVNGLHITLGILLGTFFSYSLENTEVMNWVIFALVVGKKKLSNLYLLTMNEVDYLLFRNVCISFFYELSDHIFNHFLENSKKKAQMFLTKFSQSHT